MKIFLSHSSKDEAAAIRVKLALEAAGYTVVHMSQWGTAESFLSRMNLALTNSDRMLSLWSEAYFASKNCGMELEAAVLKDQRAEGRYLAIARIDQVTPPALYAPFIWRQLELDWDDEKLRDEVIGAIGDPPIFDDEPDLQPKTVFASHGPSSEPMAETDEGLRTLMREKFAQPGRADGPFTSGERTVLASPRKALEYRSTNGRLARLLGLVLALTVAGGLAAEFTFGVNVLDSFLAAIGLADEDTAPLIEALEQFNQSMEELLP